ncbi:MAG: hypothetical protein Q4P32_02015 [Micrococcales bacterium]|nr:hypothetical protein [Micrococcales bacterium]
MSKVNENTPQRKTTDDVNVNDGDLHSRRGAAEEGRQLRLSVNTAFAEQIGEEGVASYVATIVEVGQRHQGADVADAVEALRSSWDRAGIAVPDIETRRLAEQLADPTRADLVIALDDGRVLHGDDRLGEGGNRSARQDEPGDPDRPAYS